MLVERRLARPVDRRPLPVRRRARASSWSSIRNRRDDTGWSLSAQVKPIPERLRSLWYVRQLPLIGFVVLFGFFAAPAALPVAAVAAVPLDRDRHLRAGRAVDHAARRLGRPALARAVRVRRARLADDGRAARRPRHPGAVRPRGTCRFSWRGSRPSSARPRVGVAAAIIIGIPALRARGLFLAVITLAFAVMCSNWLFRLPVLTGSEFGTTTPRIEPPVDRRHRLLQPAQPLLPLLRRARRARRSIVARHAAHGHRPFDDRGARQRGHGRGVDRRHPSRDQGHVVRGVGRHRRARGLPADHVAPAGDARRRRSRPRSRCASSRPR